MTLNIERSKYSTEFIPKKEYNTEELVQQLHDLVLKLHCAERKSLLHRTDIEEASRKGQCASYTTFLNNFLDLEGINGAAGLLLPAKKLQTKKEVEQWLIDFYKKNGHPPKTEEIRAGFQNNTGPSFATVKKYFPDGLKVAYTALGLKPLRGE